MQTIFLHWVAFVLWVITIPFSANVLEWRVHHYTLNDVLNGAETVFDWENKRKPELVKLFETNVYGALPTETIDVRTEMLEEGVAFPGTDHEAYRRQVALTLSRAGRSATLQLLIYTPVRHPGVAQGEGEGYPVVLSLNFFGNHSLTADPAVLPSRVWSRRIPGREVPFKEESRNAWRRHLPIEEILTKGYAVATVYYGDIDPDFNDGFKNGVHAFFPEREAGSWGSVSAWAWGMSQVMNYLELEIANSRRHAAFGDRSEALAQILVSSSSTPAARIDPTRVALFGFSRLGKSALWAAANDSRFSTVISDSAGEGGDSLSKRNFGETIRLMTLRFPHWFNSTYKTYAMHEEQLPVDQHELLALIAPRPLLISAAAGDWWSDPKGTAEAARSAQSVYELYNAGENLTFDLHLGVHDVTLEEWEVYLTFLDKHL